VFFYESQTPVIYPEVCLFGTDTLCIRGDRDGRFRAQLTERQVETGTIVVRFRAEGLQPATADVANVTTGERFVVNCAISDRVSLSSGPVPCLPIPADAADPPPADTTPANPPPDEPQRG